MLRANLIYLDPEWRTLILAHLNKYFKCSLYYDTMVIQIDLLMHLRGIIDYSNFASLRLPNITRLT